MTETLRMNRGDQDSAGHWADRAWWADRGWWADHEAYADRPADLFAMAVESGQLNLPLPGGGRTGERFAALAMLGEFDPVQAQLGAGHADALALLAELDGPLPEADRWVVWTAGQASLTAIRAGEGWQLDGERDRCPGATACTRVLVAAEAPDGLRLFAAPNPGPVAVPDRWPIAGLATRDALPVRFAAVPAVPVGGPGDLADRPAAWHAAIGAAACWYGGAVGVARPLLAAARPEGGQPAGAGVAGRAGAGVAGRAGAGRHAAEPDAPPPSVAADPHLLAHLGAVDAALAAAAALLRVAATAIDTDPKADARRLAGRTRLGVHAVVTEVLDRVGRALGADPLCHDARHARRVADLTVQLRQCRIDAETTGLGSRTAMDQEPDW